MVAVAEFVHEPADLVALNAVLAGRSRLARLGGHPGAVLIGGAAALVAARTAWPGGAVWPVSVAAVLGSGLGGLLQRVVGRPAGAGSARLLARGAWAAARREGRVVPQRLEVAPEGLRAASDAGETLTRWSAVREVVRTEGHVFVFVARRVAFMAPRRAFGSAEAFEAFGREAEARWRAARAATPAAAGRAGR